MSLTFGRMSNLGPKLFMGLTMSLIFCHDTTYVPTVNEIDRWTMEVLATLM